MKTLNQDITEEETARPLTTELPAAEFRDPVVSCPVVSLKRYGLAMNATAFDAAIHALVIFCGVAGAHEATQWVPALTLQQLGAVFLIAFGRAMLAYVAAHPVAAALAAVGRVPPPGVFAPPPGVAMLPPDALVPARPLREGRRPANAGDTAGSPLPPQSASGNPHS